MEDSIEIKIKIILHKRLLQKQWRHFIQWKTQYRFCWNLNKLQPYNIRKWLEKKIQQSKYADNENINEGQRKYQWRTKKIKPLKKWQHHLLHKWKKKTEIDSLIENFTKYMCQPSHLHISCLQTENPEQKYFLKPIWTGLWNPTIQDYQVHTNWDTESNQKSKWRTTKVKKQCMRLPSPPTNTHQENSATH